ncbi:MAG: hypothetical protein AAF907_01650, partial [Planctomycetota bacterium]
MARTAVRVKTLSRRGHAFADPAAQLRVLNGVPAPKGLHVDDLKQSRPAPDFDGALANAELPPLRAASLETLQVNVGKLCNMTCQHCHVDAGPDRKAENMCGET